MKTALRATRIAFSVDLLTCATPSKGDDGAQLLGEQGEPLEFKSHLVTFSSLTKVFSTVAGLGGLVVGSDLMKMVGGQTWLLFAVDVITNLGFIYAMWRWCAPPACLIKGKRWLFF